MNFLKKIFSPIILVISFLLFIYTFFMSEVHYDGSKRSYYLTYYLISLILILFSIASFFFNKKIKEYLIISSMSLLISLYFFEGYIIIKELSKESQHSQQLTKENFYEKQTGKKWDKRNKFEVYDDYKKINKEIVMAVSPYFDLKKNYSIFRLSGTSNSQTIFCNENGYFSIFLSDRYGFNNPNIEWDTEEVEYLLVGDSFTQGACVNRPNDIGSVLRAISKKSSLNLGQNGNGPLIQFATLREYLDTNVKNVLWFYYEGNDLTDLVKEKKNKILANYLNDLNFTQNLKLKQKEIDDLTINILNEEIKKNNTITKKINLDKKTPFFLRLIKFIKIDKTRFFIHSKLERLPETEFKEILKLVKEFVEQNNSKLYFVYLPEYHHYKKNYNDKKYVLVKNIVNELNISFIDIHKEVFEKEQNPLKLFPFELFGHYNAEGYKKIAETIFEFTKN